MSKRATVEPAWLDAMLVAWGRIKVQHALGFPTASFMFKERVPSPATSFEPTGYCGLDFRALEAALDTLETQHKYAILHCYKPWTAESVRDAYAQEFGIFWSTDAGKKRIQRLLHEAASLLRAHMDKAQDVPPSLEVAA
jgi:hypothetical protein